MSIRIAIAVEQRRKAERERAHRQALLQRRAAERAERRGDSNKRRVHRSHLAVEDVDDDTGRRGDADRGERGRRRGAHLPASGQQEQRHDHDPAADAEQCAEETGDEPDED